MPDLDVFDPVRPDQDRMTWANSETCIIFNIFP